MRKLELDFELQVYDFQYEKEQVYIKSHKHKEKTTLKPLIECIRSPPPRQSEILIFFYI